MLTTTHGYATWLLTRGRRRAPFAVVGSTVPDLPALALAMLALKRRADTSVVDAIYLDERFRWLHLTTHSVFGPLALAAASRRGSRARALAIGWAGHLAVDLVTHHSDAWPFLWPLTQRAWPSPVSYWEPEHHARGLRSGELATIVGAGLLGRSRTSRAAAFGAFAVAAIAGGFGTSLRRS